MRYNVVTILMTPAAITAQGTITINWTGVPSPTGKEMRFASTGTTLLQIIYPATTGAFVTPPFNAVTGTTHWDSRSVYWGPTGSVTLVTDSVFLASDWTGTYDVGATRMRMIAGPPPPPPDKCGTLTVHNRSGQVIDLTLVRANGAVWEEELFGDFWVGGTGYDAPIPPGGSGTFIFFAAPSDVPSEWAVGRVVNGEFFNIKTFGNTVFGNNPSCTSFTAEFQGGILQSETPATTAPGDAQTIVMDTNSVVNKSIQFATGTNSAKDETLQTGFSSIRNAITDGTTDGREAAGSITNALGAGYGVATNLAGESIGEAGGQFTYFTNFNAGLGGAYAMVTNLAIPGTGQGVWVHPMLGNMMPTLVPSSWTAPAAAVRTFVLFAIIMAAFFGMLDVLKSAVVDWSTAEQPAAITDGLGIAQTVTVPAYLALLVAAFALVIAAPVAMVTYLLTLLVTPVVPAIAADFASVINQLLPLTEAIAIGTAYLVVSYSSSMIVAGAVAFKTFLFKS